MKNYVDLLAGCYVNYSLFDPELISVTTCQFPPSIFSSEDLQSIVDKTVNPHGNTLGDAKSNFSKLIFQIIRAKFFYQNGVYEGCFTALTEMLNCIKRLVKREIIFWIDAVLGVVLNEIVMIEKEIDLESDAQIVQALRSCEVECKKCDSKMRLKITNLVIRLHFQVHNYEPCKSIFNSDIVLSPYPIGHQIMYKYYYGKFFLFNSKYYQARNAFAESWSLCPSNMTKNKRLILMYLAPLNTYFGRLPKDELLQKYGLYSEYHDLLLATRSGDIKLFQEVCDDKSNWFSMTGVTLLIEKLRMIAFKSFVRTVYTAYLPYVDERMAHQFKLEKCFTVLKYLGIEMSPDDFECILANLVYSNHIRGYLSSSHETQLVFGKEPFRKLSQNERLKKN